MEDTQILALEEKLAYLERHIEEQDAEIFRLAQQLKALTSRLALTEERLQALKSSDGGDRLNLHEKPPHY